MVTDRYTKFILTVIALCLVILCWQNLSLRSVKAQPRNEQEVVITGIGPTILSDSIPVRIVDSARR